MLDDLVTHADIASLHIVFHVLLHGRPVEAAGEKLCCSVSPKVPCVGGVVVFRNEARPECRMFWDEQAGSFKKYKVIL